MKRYFQQYDVSLMHNNSIAWGAKFFSLSAASIFIFIILLSRAVKPVAAVGATFAWRSHGGTANQLHFGFVDLDGATPLQTGDLVQLIWAGPDGLIHPPDPATGLPTGDDQIVDTNIVENGPPPKYELGYVPLKTTNYDTTDAWANGQVYMRVWNGAGLPGSGAADEANAYGDSLNAVQLANGGGHNFVTAPEGQRAQVQTFTAVSLRDFGLQEPQSSDDIFYGFGLMVALTLFYLFRFAWPHTKQS